MRGAHVIRIFRIGMIEGVPVNGKPVFVGTLCDICHKPLIKGDTFSRYGNQRVTHNQCWTWAGLKDKDGQIVPNDYVTSDVTGKPLVCAYGRCQQYARHEFNMSPLVDSPEGLLRIVGGPVYVFCSMKHQLAYDTPYAR